MAEWPSASRSSPKVDIDATVVDFWRMLEYRDPRMWDVDRIHMSSVGHQHMAAWAVARGPLAPVEADRPLLR